MLGLSLQIEAEEGVDIEVAAEGKGFALFQVCLIISKLTICPLNALFSSAVKNIETKKQAANCLLND